MPRNDALDWVTLADFSHGLWNAASSFLMPAEAFQTMENCYPQPGGGVRAFYKPTAIATTGLSLTTERLVAFHTQLLADLSESMLVLTQVVSTGTMKAYYKSSAASSWTLTKTFGTPSSATIGFGSIAHYDTGAGVYYFVVNVPYVSGSDQGIWTFNPATNTWAQIKTAVAGPVVNYQGRIVAGNLTQLIWTDPGGVTFPAANTLNLYQGSVDFRSAVASLLPFSPSQLVVATSQDVWFSIEGDINDPVARVMGRTVLPGISQTMAAEDDGVIFFSPARGIYAAANSGSTFDRLDPNLTPPVFPSPATQAYPFPSIAATGRFIWTPGGSVYFKETRSWFTVPESASGKPVYFFWQREDSEVVGLQYGSGGVLYDWNVGETGQRQETYTLKTAPLHADGRQIAIREVQVSLVSYNSAATVAVTVNGTTRTSAALGVGANVVSFLFAERGEYLDVTFVAASNVSLTEAPTIESVKIGTRPDGHQIH